MGTTADKLNHLINTKEGIRQEINRAYNTEEIGTSDTFNSYIQKLEEHPFYLKRLVEGSIESVKVTNVTSIGIHAFYKCSKLTSVLFPSTTSIGDRAFYQCSSLTSVSFPNAIGIGEYAFHKCNNLTEVSFPNATSIDYGVFQSCSKLTSASFPKVTNIGGNAFYQCSGLTSVSIPNATSIGNYAFYGCSSLTSASFPNATTIGSNAFSSCSKLTSVSFPNATSIGNSAFYKCSNLTTIYVGINTSTVCTLSSTSAFSSCTNLTSIYVPASLVNSYKSATNWSSFASKIKAVPTPMPIGGKIFYDAGDNGATYTFYDSNGNIINDTSISGLQNAVKYKVEGTPSSDRFYAVYPSMLNSGNNVYWGFYYNKDIKSSGGNIVNTGEAIGTGKTATQAILNYIDTYASGETASSSKPGSDISQSSHGSYNLYKNCGTSYNYLWDIVRDANENSLGGHNDWFVPSKDEMKQIGTSGIISDITGSHYLWSGSAYSFSYVAWCWDYNFEYLNSFGRNDINSCVVCRAF